MDNSGKTDDFLKYINNPLARTSIDLLFNANNVVFERCDLYRDFTLSLMDLVFDTYLGDDVTTIEDRLKHFDWCWKKNLANFKEEGINFYDSDELYDYFINFTVDYFYSISDKGNIKRLKTSTLKVWSVVFNYRITKTRSDVDMFIELYRMFEKSLQKGKKT